MRWGMHRSAFSRRRGTARISVFSAHRPSRETAIQTPADRLTYAAATPAALSTISLHADVEAPPPFYQDSAARRLRRPARIPVGDRFMACLVVGAQSREHRLLGCVSF